MYYVEAKEAVDPIIDLAQKSGYKSRLGQILTIVGTYNSLVEEDAPKALKHLGEAFESSEAVKDSASLALASHRLGVALYVNCEFKKALYYLEKAANIHEAANNLWGVSAIKSAISVFVYYLQGRINLGYQTSDEAIQMAEESGDIYSKSWAYLSHGICCGGKGFFEDATKYLLKGISFCEKINLLIWNVIARIFIGENYFRIGDYQNVKDHYEKAVQLGEPTGFLPSWINLYRIGIAKAKVMMNERDIELESLYTYVKDNKIKIFEGWMRNYIGQILLNIDDRHMSDAEHWINKAIEANKRNGMMFHLGKDYALYAELFKRKKNQSKAEENKNKAINIFRECGADGWIETWEMS